MGANQGPPVAMSESVKVSNIYTTVPLPNKNTVAAVAEDSKSCSASSSYHSSLDPRVQWMQNCVIKLLSREFTAAEMVSWFTELNNNLINMLNDAEKFKYIFIWRTLEPIPTRLDDDDFVETRKAGFKRNKFSSRQI